MSEPAPLFHLWPKQVQAMQLLGLDDECPVETPVQEMLYGGEPGGGKSRLLRVLALFLCLEYWPGCRGVLFRKTFPELHDNHLLPLMDELPGLGAGTFARYNASDHEVRFTNGSVLQFRHCEREEDVYKYQGAEWDFLLVDEATQLSKEQYSYLRTRVRSTKPGWRRLIVACANPGGPGHEYFLENFVDAAPEGDVFIGTDEEGDPTWPCVFLRAQLSDNPSLSKKDYEKAIASIADPVLRRAYLSGDWHISGDRVFNEWDRNIHVCERFEIPQDWTRWCGLDYGYADPTCCLWMARVPPNTPIPVKTRSRRHAEGYRVISDRPRIVVYRELYQTRLYPQMQALRIKQMSQGERISAIWADASMFRSAPGQNYAAEYRAGGLSVTPVGSRDVKLRVARIHRALDSHDLTPPEILVFETCHNLIREIPAIPRDKNDPEKYDTTKSDHAIDSLGYGLLGSTRRKAPEMQTYKVMA